MKTHLFISIILFAFIFSKVEAQCPSGDVTLLSQAEVDNFVATYPNCTHISGDFLLGEFNNGSYNINNLSGLKNLTKIDGVLGVFGTNLTSLNGLNNLNEAGSVNIVGNNLLTSITELINITELSSGQLQIAWNETLQSLQGLNNIQIINGRLYLGHDNNSLTSLSGLNNLVSVGGLVYIYGTKISTLEGLNNLTTVGEWIGIGYNEQLTSIEALQNLISVGSSIFIENNPQLISLNGIQNLNLSSLAGENNGLYVENNENLSTCNLPNICQYLSFDPTENPREITENTGNCTDEQAVLAACDLGVNDIENESMNWQVHYKKENNSFLVQSKGFQISDLQIYNLKGQLIKEIKNLNSNREEINVFSAENILIIKVISADGKSFAKKVIVK